MFFKLEIKLGNDAMQTGGDVAEALRDVVEHPKSGASWRCDLAMSLPQDERREVEVAQADGIIRAQYAAKSWVAGISDAAFNLRELVVVHDNGGTASSIKKIKEAARELVRLLGED